MFLATDYTDFTKKALKIGGNRCNPWQVAYKCGQKILIQSSGYKYYMNLANSFPLLFVNSL